MVTPLMSNCDWRLKYKWCSILYFYLEFSPCSKVVSIKCYLELKVCFQKASFIHPFRDTLIIIRRKQQKLQCSSWHVLVSLVLWDSPGMMVGKNCFYISLDNLQLASYLTFAFSALKLLCEYKDGCERSHLGASGS